MAGEQLLRNLNALRLAAVLALIATTINASDELPDIEFLEWLGQVTEVEDLGMDINEILEEREETQSESNTESTK